MRPKKKVKQSFEFLSKVYRLFFYNKIKKSEIEKLIVYVS